MVHYRVWCREELQRRFQESTEEAKEEVKERLSLFGGLDALFEDGTTTSNLAQEFVLPLEQKKRPLGLLRTLKIRLTGTPWDLPRQ